MKPPDPPTPFPPTGQGEHRGGKGAPEGRESCRDRPYKFERSLLPPGARTELRLYRCSPEFVRSLLALAVLCCPCVARLVVSRLSCCAGRSPDFPDRQGYSVIRCRQLATKPTPAGRYLRGNINKLQKKTLFASVWGVFGVA